MEYLPSLVPRRRGKRRHRGEKANVCRRVSLADTGTNRYRASLDQQLLAARFRHSAFEEICKEIFRNHARCILVISNGRHARRYNLIRSNPCAHCARLQLFVLKPRCLSAFPIGCALVSPWVQKHRVASRKFKKGDSTRQHPMHQKNQRPCATVKL